jgi:methyl-accepting chemotaxis protein
MPKHSLFRPVLVVSLLLILLSVTVASVFLYTQFVSPLESQFLTQSLAETQAEMDNRINSKIEEGKAMAISINGYAEILQGLKDGDREPVAEKLKNIKAHFAEQSKYKNIAVQIIDQDNISFVKSWNLDSFGEMVKHPMLTEMHKTKHVVGGIAVGAQGFGVIAFAPVKQKEQILGAVVTAGGVGAIVKELKSAQQDWVLILNKSYIETRYQGIPLSLKSNKVVGDWMFAHNNWFDSETINTIEKNQHWLTADKEKHAYLIGNQVVMSLPMMDETGQLAGRHILVKSAESLLIQIKQAQASIISLVIQLMIGFIIVVSVILLMVRARAIRPMQTLVKKLCQISQEGRFNQTLPVERLDEIGQVFSAVNQLMSQLDHAIIEANQVVAAIAAADFTQRIQGHYVGDLDHLKSGINASAESVAFMMNELSLIMKSLSEGEFSVTMNQRVPAAFRNQVDSALGNISAIVTEINNVMDAMSQGDFNLRVNVTAQGELSDLVNNINHSMDNIAVAVNAISHVIAAQAAGDLTQSLPTGTFKGQLHDLKNAINYSTKKVKETVLESIKTAENIHTNAQLVAKGAMNLSGRVHEQASALEETSATMNEMAAAVATNTENAKRVATLTNQVQNQAICGVNVMQQTITAMQSIRESSSKISTIVALIDGIAFQTNLLALNAAVEAARAGEHGRGFAVVAGEVRSLAQKAAEAANAIKTLISDSVARIEAGTQLADKSGEMLNDMKASIQDVACMIDAIASASSEQSLGIAQVNRAMSEIDRVTQENTWLVEEASTAADHLTQEADDLQKNMSFFKV